MPQSPKRVRDLASTMTARIQARTHGQVRELIVEVADEQVVIRGRARTHYAKQLAVQGVMDLITGQNISNEIIVG